MKINDFIIPSDLNGTMYSFIVTKEYNFIGQVVRFSESSPHKMYIKVIQNKLQSAIGNEYLVLKDCFEALHTIVIPKPVVKQIYEKRNITRSK